MSYFFSIPAKAAVRGQIIHYKGKRYYVIRCIAGHEFAHLTVVEMDTRNAPMEDLVIGLYETLVEEI